MRLTAKEYLAGDVLSAVLTLACVETAPAEAAASAVATRVVLTARGSARIGRMVAEAAPPALHPHSIEAAWPPEEAVGSLLVR